MNVEVEVDVDGRWLEKMGTDDGICTVDCEWF